jgi:hypothetical protein
MEGTMGRPERHDVDYFPFFAKRGKTLNILQSKYGLEGIGFFTNLMRLLALTPDHYYCIKEEEDRLNFFAEIGIQEEEKCMAIIELMVKTKKLDKRLWEDHRVIVCEAFLESLKEAYRNRVNQIITIDEIRAIFEKGEKVLVSKSDVSYAGNPQGSGVSYARNPQEGDVSCTENPQSKVKKSKEDTEASPPAFPDNPSPSKPEKAKKGPLREREPVNDMERVEKAYLLNWDTLYAQGKVKAINPVVNWNQTRKLLKTHFESLSAELIIQAVNNALNDEWVLNAGYSLGMMLSSTVLNRLINGNGAGTQKHRIAADNVSQEKASSYFREAK